MKTLDKINDYIDKLEEKKKKMKKNNKLSFLYTKEDLDGIGLDGDVKKRLIEAKKIFVSAYWSGNVLKWRTEDGRMGSDPMKKTKDKKMIQKHLEKVLGSSVNLELIKEGLFEAKKRKVGGPDYDKFYTKFFDKWAKKLGVKNAKSFKDFPKNKQDDFFNALDKAWNAKKEKD